MLQLVLVNLVSNALKFSSRRPVRRIEIAATKGQDGSVVFHVRDNGVGFNMEHANKLFGVLERLHSREEFEGAGVGLAIVSRILQKHGAAEPGQQALSVKAQRSTAAFLLKPGRAVFSPAGEEAMAELILIQVENPGPCGVCGVRNTSNWCTNCMPQHYVCSGCLESHKSSMQKRE